MILQLRRMRSRFTQLGLNESLVFDHQWGGKEHRVPDAKIFVRCAIMT